MTAKIKIPQYVFMKLIEHGNLSLITIYELVLSCRGLCQQLSAKYLRYILVRQIRLAHDIDHNMILGLMVEEKSCLKKNPMIGSAPEPTL